MKLTYATLPSRHLYKVYRKYLIYKSFVTLPIIFICHFFPISLLFSLESPTTDDVKTYKSRDIWSLVYELEDLCKWKIYIW